MTPDQLELAITHYLDGTLPAEDARTLEETLAGDEGARALLAEHEKLTALLRAEPVPEMDWPALAGDFCAVVTGTVDEPSRAEDQRLNTLLKAALTPLPEVRWEALAGRISGALDAELETAEAGDERLDELLKSDVLPALNWDRLASHISGAVAAAAEARDVDEEREEAPAVIGRIGFGRRVRAFAVAAAVAVVAAVGIKVASDGRGPVNTAKPNGTDVAVVTPSKKVVKPFIEVEGPSVEVAAKPADTEIAIGPSSEYAANSDDSYLRRNAAAREQVVIAAPVPVRSDDDSDASYMFD
jgi:anti-sigma factor RsiW